MLFFVLASWLRARQITQDFLRENTWKSHSTVLHCTDLSLSFLFRTAHVKLLPGAVGLDTNSLSEKLRTGLHLSVSFQPMFWRTSCAHIQLRNYDERAKWTRHVIRMNYDPASNQSADESICACVTTCACVCMLLFKCRRRIISVTVFFCVTLWPASFTQTYPLNLGIPVMYGLTQREEWLPSWWAGSIKLCVCQVHRVSVLGLNEANDGWQRQNRGKV